MKISHSQYYTSDEIASLMVGCITGVRVNTVLDLGAGNGVLSRAAKRRWNNAACVVADIDNNNCIILSEQGFETKQLNCVTPNLDKAIKVKYGTVDVAICNPPYEGIENSFFIKRLMNKARLRLGREEKTASSDLVFLAYNLLFLRPQGVLAIIVPYSIMAGRKYIQLRQSLLENYYVERAIELPENSFAYTEAKTGILIIRNEKSNKRETQLVMMGDNFTLSPTINLPQEDLSIRLDYSFHFWNKTHGIDDSQNENEIIVIRGRNSHDSLKKKGTPFFHTTCYERDDIDWDYQYDSKENSIVDQGSFLIARVGKRCVGRVKRIEKGRIQISDCVYGVKVPDDYVDQFDVFFHSKEYLEFIKVATRGVCSLYLCKGELESMLYHKLDEFRKDKASHDR